MYSILSSLFPVPFLLLLPKLTKAVWRWKHTGPFSQGNTLSFKPVSPSMRMSWYSWLLQDSSLLSKGHPAFHSGSSKTCQVHTHQHFVLPHTDKWNKIWKYFQARNFSWAKGENVFSWSCLGIYTMLFESVYDILVCQKKKKCNHKFLCWENEY